MNDALIVGSGLSALIAAQALHARGLKVAMISPHQWHDWPLTPERAIALSAQTLSCLRQWFGDGVSDQAAAIRTVHVSVQGRFGTLRLHAQQHNVAYFGQVVSARALQAVLLRNVQKNIKVYQGVIDTWHEDKTGMVVQLQATSNDTLSARCVVLADGCGAVMPRLLGSGFCVEDYRQVAAAMQVQTELPHRDVAYERFLPSGPLALLPQKDQQCAVVWTLPEDSALLSKSTAAWQESLQAAFGERLGQLNLLTDPVYFPLKRLRARPLSQPGVVLLGNTATQCHPAAGQGFNLAVRDVQMLAKTLSQQVSTSSQSWWQHYDRLRAQDHALISSSTDVIAKWFSQQHWHLPRLGQQGVLLLDLLPGVRHALAAGAMGFRFAPEASHA